MGPRQREREIPRTTPFIAVCLRLNGITQSPPKIYVINAFQAPAPVTLLPWRTAKLLIAVSTLLSPLLAAANPSLGKASTQNVRPFLVSIALVATAELRVLNGKCYFYEAICEGGYVRVVYDLRGSLTFNGVAGISTRSPLVTPRYRSRTDALSLRSAQT
jgi:hypothetical protein